MEGWSEGGRVYERAVDGRRQRQVHMAVQERTAGRTFTEFPNTSFRPSNPATHETANRNQHLMHSYIPISHYRLRFDRFGSPLGQDAR